MSSNLILSLDSINYSSDALANLMKIFHSLIEENILPKPSPVDYESFKLIEDNGSIFSNVSRKDIWHTPQMMNKNIWSENGLSTTYFSNTPTFSLNHYPSRNYLKIEFLKGSERIGNPLSILELLKNEYKLNNKIHSLTDFETNNSRSIQSNIEPNKNNSSNEKRQILNIPFGTTHVFFHFKANIYSKLVWDTFNGKLFKDIFTLETNDFFNNERRIQLSFWNGNRFTENVNSFSTPISDFTDTYLNKMHSQTRSNTKTEIQYNQKVFETNQEHEHLLYNSKSSKKLIINDSFFNRDSNLFGTNKWNIQVSPNRYNSKRKRENMTLDDVTTSMQDLLTPKLKRRKRAKSVDLESNQSLNHFKDISSNHKHPILNKQIFLLNHNGNRTSGVSNLFYDQLNEIDTFQKENNLSPQKTQIDNMEVSTPTSSIHISEYESNSSLSTPSNITVSPLNQKIFMHTSIFPENISDEYTIHRPPNYETQTPTRRRRRAKSPPATSEKYSNILVIDNISSQTNEEQIYLALIRFGNWKIVQIQIISKENVKQNKAVVVFQSSLDALEACNCINYRILVDTMVKSSIATLRDAIWINNLLQEQFLLYLGNDKSYFNFHPKYITSNSIENYKSNENPNNNAAQFSKNQYYEDPMGDVDTQQYSVSKQLFG